MSKNKSLEDYKNRLIVIGIYSGASFEKDPVPQRAEAIREGISTLDGITVVFHKPVLEYSHRIAVVFKTPEAMVQAEERVKTVVKNEAGYIIGRQMFALLPQCFVSQLNRHVSIAEGS